LDEQLDNADNLDVDYDELDENTSDLHYDYSQVHEQDQLTLKASELMSQKQQDDLVQSRSLQLGGRRKEGEGFEAKGNKLLKKIDDIKKDEAMKKLRDLDQMNELAREQGRQPSPRGDHPQPGPGDRGAQETPQGRHG